jgi:hypothetical protein
LYSFIDNDTDGVDDNIDKCLNTSFEDIVDIYGCPIGTTYLGAINIDVEYQKIKEQQEYYTNKNIYVDYNYNNLLINLQKSLYTIKDENYKGDLYINVGYQFDLIQHKVQTFVGIKIANGDDSVSTKTDDYIILVDYKYIDVNNFIYNTSLKYTDSNQDFINYTLALSYSVDKSVFTISYLNSGSNTQFTNQYKILDISFKYQFSDKYYINIGYNQDTVTRDNNNSYIGFGVYFD